MRCIDFKSILADPEYATMQFSLPLPPELREVLVADWERTIKAGGPRPLPRKPCVADIFKAYVAKAKAAKVGPCPPACCCHRMAVLLLQR